MQQQVVVDPCRIVGPSRLEGAIPDAGVDTSHGIVVVRYANDPPHQLERARRDRLELCRIELQADDRRTGVTQLGIDHVGDGFDTGGVGNGAAGRVRRQASYPHGPTDLGGRQVDTMGAFVLAAGLAAERRIDHWHEAAAVGGDINGVLHRVAAGVAVAGIGLRQPRNRQANPYRGQLQVTDGFGPGLVTAQFNTDRGLVFYRREARDIGLVLAAVACVEGDAAEVEAAVGVGQWRLVEKNRTLFVFQTDDLAFADEIEDAGVGRALQAVWRFHRGAGLRLATFAASDSEVSHGVPSGKIKPAQGGFR